MIVALTAEAEQFQLQIYVNILIDLNWPRN
jgi:hypothetical protein